MTVKGLAILRMTAGLKGMGIAYAPATGRLHLRAYTGCELD